MPSIIERSAKRKIVVLASQAGIPYPTLLSYFSIRNEIVLAYLDYIADNSVR